MEITSSGAGEFRKLAGKFKAAGKDGAAIRKGLTKRIQVELKVTVADIKHEVAGITVKGLSGHSTLVRERHYGAHHKRAARAGHSLRQSVARTIKSRVSYTGRKIGARIYVDASTMPNSQRKLPAYLNSAKGWRHPVWGHRDRWVRQVGEPYFDRIIARRAKSMRTAVDEAVRDVMKELQK
jgi:hypothetical protein